MTDKEKELADKRFEMQGVVGDEAFLKAREQVRADLEEREKKNKLKQIKNPDTTFDTDLKRNKTD